MPALTLPSPTGNISSLSPTVQAPGSSASQQSQTQSQDKSVASTSTPTSRDASDAQNSPAEDRPPESPLSETESFPPAPPPPQPAVKERKKLTPTSRFIDHPQPIPISESTNTDAIALRSTISLLQLQKQKGIRDIQTLQQLKEAAVAEPESFVTELKAGTLSGNFSRSDLLGPSLSQQTPKPSKNTTPEMGADRTIERGDIDIESEIVEKQSVLALSTFGPIPQPQNVVRVPPINWDKYHIVGPSLDKIHEEQRARPNFTKFGASTPSSALAPKHVIAKPYDPFKDALSQKQVQQKRKDSKRPS